MKKLLTIVCLIGVISGCRNADKKDSANDTTRHVYTAESNPVEIIVLQEKTFNKELVSNGKLNANRKSVIGYKTSGIISSINVQNGDYVAAGTVLARLESIEAENSLNSARENFEKARIDLFDAIIGFGYDGTDTINTPLDILATAKIRSGYNLAVISLANAENALKACIISAPFPGKIANLAGKAYERTGESLCTLIDDSKMDVEFNIVESELGLIRKGQIIKVVSFFNPEIVVKGTIISINPSVDKNGQVMVKAEVNNSQGFLDGMNVKVIVEEEVPFQLVVPKSAVVIRDNLEVLFRYADGRAQWTYVHILMDNSDNYVVAPNTSRGAELFVGDSIIVSGNLNLADQSVVELKARD